MDGSTVAEEVGSETGRRARLLALTGLGLVSVIVAAVAVAVAVAVGCYDYEPGGCVDRRHLTLSPRRPPVFFPLVLQNYERAPAQYAAILRANMDLLEAAPAAYAAWVRANRAGPADEMSCRLTLLVNARDLSCLLRTRIGDDPERVYLERNIRAVSTDGSGRPVYLDANRRRVVVYVHDYEPHYAAEEARLRASAPAEHVALDDALQEFLEAWQEFIRRPSVMPFLRYTVVPRGTQFEVQPVVSIGEALGWRRAARMAALRRMAYAETRLQNDAPAEFDAWRQRRGMTFGHYSVMPMGELAALIEAAPAAYAALVRAMADLVSASPATFDYHFLGQYRSS